MTILQGCANKFSICICAKRLGTLDRCTKSTVDDKLWEDTKGSRHTEEDCVVAGFTKTIVLEKDARVLAESVDDQTSSGIGETHSINVGIRVLGFAMLGQNTWRDFVNLAYKLEHGVIW